MKLIPSLALTGLLALTATKSALGCDGGTCGCWEVETWQGATCQLDTEYPTGTYEDSVPSECISLGGFSVSLDSISILAESNWYIQYYDNDDCTCSNPLTCPGQISADEGTQVCNSASDIGSFYVNVAEGCTY